jgi:hypothetical protein
MRNLSWIVVVCVATLFAACGGGGGGSVQWVHPADTNDFLSFDGTSVHYAEVAMNSSGDAVLVWHQGNYGDRKVYLAEKNGRFGYWTWPVDDTDYINPDGGDSDYPSVVMDDSGNAIVAWSQSDVSGSAWLFVSVRDGSTGNWTHPSSLNDHFAGVNYYVRPEPAMGRGGDAIVAWSERSSAGTNRVYSSLRAGAAGSWSVPLDHYVDVPPHTFPNAIYIGKPEAGMDDVGDVIMAWTQTSGMNTSWIFVSERDGASDTWDQPAAASDSIAMGLSGAGNARVGMAGSGAAVISWFETVGGDQTVFAASRDGNTGDWTYPADTADALSPDGSNARFNRSAVNGHGDAVAVWRQYDGTGHDQIFMAERGGDTGLWKRPADLSDNISPDGTNASEREVAMDDSGHAVVAWRQVADGYDRMFISERNCTGKAWVHPLDTDSYVSPAGSGGASPPLVAVGGSGNAIVLWRQTGLDFIDRLYMSEKR